MAADGNGDGLVNMADLEIWQEMFGVTLDEVIEGDFNGDGVVSTDDEVLWQAGDLLADANADGVVDQLDHDVWQANFGRVYAGIYPSLLASDAAIHEVPMLPPQVIGLQLSASEASAYDFADLVGSGEQLRSVDASGVDTVSITFSEEVVVAESDLLLNNLDGASPAAVSQFTYDSETRTATWTFDAALADGRTLLTLSDSIYDLDGDALDGEFTNPWSLSEVGSAVFPSGDGEAGGEFRFRFTVLENDTDRDNIDGATDYTSWRSYEPGMILVSTLADENDGDHSVGDTSLREAIALAASQSGADEIIFWPSLLSGGPATILLGDADSDGLIGAGETPSSLLFDSDVSLVGPGKDLLTLSGGDATRVAIVSSGVAVKMSGVTIAHGYRNGWHGGGIYNEGDLTLEYVTVRDNDSVAHRGGGIYSIGGDLSIFASTIADNEGEDGAGIAFRSGSQANTLRIDSSTIASNNSQGSGRGGGLYIYDFSSTPSTTTIINSTFSGNEANIAGSIGTAGTPIVNIYGSTITENHARQSTGGAHNNDSTSAGADITMHFSIVAGNTGVSYFSATDIEGPLNAASSYNLVGLESGSGLVDGVNGNIIIGAGDPGLTALGDHGGLTETHALLEGSLAIAAGDAAFADLLGLNLDQRGVVRSGFVDLGAFQLAADEYFGTVA